MVESEGLRIVQTGHAGQPRLLTGFAGDVLEPLRLTNGAYLRLAVGLTIHETDQGPRLKVSESTYQYQVTTDAKTWVCRYDYVRQARNDHPQAHVQVNGDLAHGTAYLHKVHFPTGRVSLEAIIRMLVEEFDVPTNTDRAIWRPVLAESERAFEEIAHRPLSGPAG